MFGVAALYVFAYRFLSEHGGDGSLVVRMGSSTTLPPAPPIVALALDSSTLTEYDVPSSPTYCRQLFDPAMGISLYGNIHIMTCEIFRAQNILKPMYF